jgi:NADH-quinone oxidoreductase subunit E
MRSVEQILREHQELTAEHLIPLLQEIQRELGYVPSSALARVSCRLHVPVSRVYGVATFYNQFRFSPLAPHVIEVCRGTACHVKQSLTLYQHLQRRLALRDDGTSRDKQFSVLTVACLGACSIAPVMRLDGEFHGHLTADKVDALLAQAVKGSKEGVA